MFKEIRSLFGTNEAIILTAILITGIAAGRMPDFKGFAAEYPTVLYNTLATIAQGVAPLLAVVLALVIYRREKGKEEDVLMKGGVILGITLSLALFGLPFSHDLHSLSGVGQGIAVALVLAAIWGVWTVISGMMRREEM